jgi:hypothetical protein
MSAPKVKSIAPEERKLWEQHNIETLREWREISFTRKIQMLEDMEEVARAFHGGKLPPSPDEHEERRSL